jgi:hypothetical protein
VAAICGRKGHDQKECSIGNIDVGIYEIHGTHASSRNVNDTWAGTQKKEHFNGVGHEGSIAIE